MKDKIITPKSLQVLYQKIAKKEPISFAELITLVENYVELSFYYHKKHYGMTHFKGHEIYEWNKIDTYQTFQTAEEFANKATIDGVLLKDAFPSIEKLNLA